MGLEFSTNYFFHGLTPVANVVSPLRGWIRVIQNSSGSWPRLNRFNPILTFLCSLGCKLPRKKDDRFPSCPDIDAFRYPGEQDLRTFQSLSVGTTHEQTFVGRVYASPIVFREGW